jgi:hypothetical protein
MPEVQNENPVRDARKTCAKAVPRLPEAFVDSLFISTRHATRSMQAVLIPTRALLRPWYNGGHALFLPVDATDPGIGAWFYLSRNDPPRR